MAPCSEPDSIQDQTHRTHDLDWSGDDWLGKFGRCFPYLGRAMPMPVHTTWLRASVTPLEGCHTKGGPSESWYVHNERIVSTQSMQHIRSIHFQHIQYVDK